MKVTSIGATPQNANTGAQSSSQQEARARAIATLTGGNTQINQNQVQPEEASVIRNDQNSANLTQVETVASVESEDSVIKAAESTEEVKTPQDQKALTPQQLALIRREKALRAKAQSQDQAFKAREAQLAAREEQLKAKEQQYSGEEYIPKSQLKAQTLRSLADAGVSYDELTQQYLNQEAINPQMQAYIDKLEAKVSAIERSNEEAKKAQSAQQDQAYQAAVKQIDLEVRSLVKADPEFETIKATGSYKDVVELIEKTFKEEGRLMTAKEASMEVEEYLVEEASKLARLEKIKRRLAPAPAPKTVEQKQPADTKQTQPAKTLTNAMSSSAKLSARERAILAMEGKLKS